MASIIEQFNLFLKSFHLVLTELPTSILRNSKLFYYRMIRFMWSSLRGWPFNTKVVVDSIQLFLSIFLLHSL